MRGEQIERRTKKQTWLARSGPSRLFRSVCIASRDNVIGEKETNQGRRQCEAVSGENLENQFLID